MWASDNVIRGRMRWIWINETIPMVWGQKLKCRHFFEKKQIECECIFLQEEDDDKNNDDDILIMMTKMIMKIIMMYNWYIQGVSLVCWPLEDEELPLPLVYLAHSYRFHHHHHHHHHQNHHHNRHRHHYHLTILTDVHTHKNVIIWWLSNQLQQVKRHISLYTWCLLRSFLVRKGIASINVKISSV